MCIIASDYSGFDRGVVQAFVLLRYYEAKVGYLYYNVFSIYISDMTGRSVFHKLGKIICCTVFYLFFIPLLTQIGQLVLKSEFKR